MADRTYWRIMTAVMLSDVFLVVFGAMVGGFLPKPLGLVWLSLTLLTTAGVYALWLIDIIRDPDWYAGGSIWTY